MTGAVLAPRSEKSRRLTCHCSMPNLCMGSLSYVSVSLAMSGFSAYSAHPSVKAV